jgi:hypothetical protein
MAIPWLSALKVIPWGDVIAHAPTVLEKARDLMERKTAPQPMATPNDTSSEDIPSLGELKNRLMTAHQQLDQLQQGQTQLAQTVAELAEQNAALLAAVGSLRRTLRMTVMALVLAFVGLGGLAYSRFF